MKMLKLSPLQFVLFLGVLHLFCASLSFAAPLEASWKMALSGNDSSNNQATSKFVGFGLEAKSKYWLHPNLFFTLDPSLRFENGSYQTLNEESNKESGVYLKEAAAHWTIFESSTLSAGALNQSVNHSSLLIGDQAFPGLRAKQQIIKTDYWQTSLSIQQSIPTSRSLSTNTTSVESTPRFLSASLSLNFESSRSFWKNRLGVFSFDNLPSAIAHESGIKGNTVSNYTESESRFSYGFQGLEVTTEFRAPILRIWEFFTELSFVQNDKAINNLNRAYLISAGSEIFLPGRKSLEIRATGFRIEPDAAVAYFTPGSFFNTNRIGYNIESFVNLKKYQFRAGARYSEAEVLFLNPAQSREKHLMLLLETSYANI